MFDKKGLQFHIKSNDYFGTHATVLNLYRELFDTQGYSSKYSKKLLSMIEELMYLQENHIITSKPSKKRQRLYFFSERPTYGYACKGSLSPLPTT